MIKRYGIADCHGIESYLDDTQFKKANKTALCMRAMANRQRHAVVYSVLISEEADGTINRLLEKGKPKAALLVLKANAERIGFPQSSAKPFEKSWKLIPNSDLDPFKV